MYVTQKKYWQKENLQIKYIQTYKCMFCWVLAILMDWGCVFQLCIFLYRWPMNWWMRGWGFVRSMLCMSPPIRTESDAASGPADHHVLPQWCDTTWNSASQQGVTEQFLSWSARRSCRFWTTPTGARGYLCWSDVKCIEKDLQQEEAAAAAVKKKTWPVGKGEL